MRLFGITLLAGLFMVGVASALPTMAGGGGTIYIDSMANGAQAIQYIDLNADWTVKGTGTLATLSDNAMTTGSGGSRQGYGLATAFSTDMGGVYHGGTLALTANNQLVTVSGQSGTATVVNATVATTSVNLSMFDPKKVTAVGSGFTGSGFGFAVAGIEGINTWAQVWTGSGSSYTTGTEHYLDWSHNTPNYENSPLVYTNCNATIGATHVTGMVAFTDAENSSKVIQALFKTDTGWTGTRNPAVGEIAGGNLSACGMAANALSNGVPDIYYAGAVGTIQLDVMAADGTWVNSNTGIANGSSMTVVTGTDGSQALLVMSLLWTAELGLYNTINIYAIDSTTGALSGGQAVGTTFSSLAYAPSGVSYGQSIAFEALGGSQQQAPEPATLMLVGTGVLGLAGIIRRRLIS